MIHAIGILLLASLVQEKAPLAPAKPPQAGTATRVVLEARDRAARADANSALPVMWTVVPRAEGLYRFMAGLDDGLGASLSRLDSNTRAQLKLGKAEEGPGVWVESVLPNSPAERAGLRSDDILISLDETPIKQPQDLGETLKESGDGVLSLHILRAGKAQVLPVRKRIEVRLAPAEESETEFFIGVDAEPIRGLVRGHLNLPENQGLAIQTVVEDGPAQKAGVLVGDILLQLNDRPVGDVGELSAVIQGIGAHSASMRLIREGKPLELIVTPAARPSPELFQAEFVLFLTDSLSSNSSAGVGASSAQETLQEVELSFTEREPRSREQPAPESNVAECPAAASAASIEQLSKEIHELRAIVEELRATLKESRK